MPAQPMQSATWRNPWRLVGWGTALLILLIPAVAMRFTSEVSWGPGDFVVAAGLLGLTGLALEFAVRTGPNLARRTLLSGAIVAALLIVWAELAVGIF